MTLQLTELCAVSAHQRVLAQVTLAGRLSVLDDPAPPGGPARLLLRVTGVLVTVPGAGLAEPRAYAVSPAAYRAGEPDPLHSGAAEQLQHLAAHHPEAIGVLSRLCAREVLNGVTRVLPVTLDRYGIVLRVESLRGHRDVRLPFSRRVDTGAEAAVEMRLLLAAGGRRRPCGR